MQQTCERDKIKYKSCEANDGPERAMLWKYTIFTSPVRATVLSQPLNPVKKGVLRVFALKDLRLRLPIHQYHVPLPHLLVGPHHQHQHQEHQHLAEQAQ